VLVLTLCLAAFGWIGARGMLAAVIAGLVTGVALKLLQHLLK
jgi:hypothetical protein